MFGHQDDTNSNLDLNNTQTSGTTRHHNDKEMRTSYRHNQKNTQDLRRTLMERRRQDTVTLRKQKREERLQARRYGKPSKTGDAVTAATATGVSSQLVATLAKYLHTGELLHLISMQQLVASHNQDANRLFQELINETPVPARAQDFVNRLEESLRIMSRHLPQSPGGGSIDQGLEIVFQVLYAISSCPKAASLNTKESYYGHGPACWVDLVLNRENEILDTLLNNSRALQQGVVSNMLGNFVQAGGDNTTKLFLPHWDKIVSFLPTTSYLCAAVAQKNVAELGTTFLAPLKSHQFIGLLQNRDSMVDAAWFLEGVTRREDAAVEKICQDQALINAIVTTWTGQQQQQQSNVNFLHPLVKALGNMAIACDGLYVTYLLQNFGELLNQLLQQGSVLEAVRTVSCFLLDAGRPQHISTELALPTFAPSLFSMIEKGMHDWKREAVVALELTMAEPPQGKVICREVVNATEILWHMLPHPQTDFLELLLDLSNNPDVAASLPAIRVLNQLVRTIPNAPELFMDVPGVVDVLHQIVSVGSNEPGALVNVRAEIAVDLLDDYFENSEEEVFNQGMAAVTSNGTFAFGQTQSPTQPPQQFHFGEPHPDQGGRGRGRPVPSWMEPTQAPPLGQGRGRGRPVPAWMSRPQD